MTMIEYARVNTQIRVSNPASRTQSDGVLQGPRRHHGKTPSDSNRCNDHVGKLLSTPTFHS